MAPIARAPAGADKLRAILAAYYENTLSLPDGIYLGLDNDRYHADSALGSTGIRDLLKGANLFWHKSRMNPKRKPDKSTPSKILGSATHKLLLEGMSAYEKIYRRGPWAEGDDLSPAEKGALTKEAKKKLLEGQELIPADDYDFVEGCKSILDGDPELRGCLDNALTEVSIFWTRPDGVRVKARLDALKLRGIGDIKTIANERERDLELACRLDITTYRYDMPAEHYSDGRRQLGPLLNAGKVFICDGVTVEGGTPKMLGPKVTGSNDLAFLNNCAKMTEFGFQFVFIPKKGAPDAWSCTLSQGNPILDEARTDIESAIKRYRDFMQAFGPQNRWMPLRKVGELYLEDMPSSFGRRTRAQG